VRRGQSLLWLVAAIAATACGGAGEPPVRRTVFDPSGMAANAAPVEVGSTSGPQLETPFPPLDRTDGWMGVSVLRDGVRFSRPTRWMIRDAGVDPGHAYIQYVSPSAYSFAVYERSDAPSDLWRDIEQRFEDDVVAAGAKVVGRNAPMATGTNQGRAYTIERKTPAPSRSREILIRSDHRVVLVQVVSQDKDLSRMSAELLEVFANLEVL
jgi:hypothetical protein